jgi:hypothetical protein
MLAAGPSLTYTLSFGTPEDRPPRTWLLPFTRAIRRASLPRAMAHPIFGPPYLLLSYLVTCFTARSLHSLEAAAAAQ